MGWGGVFPNGSDYYAVGRGDSILSHPTAIVEWAARASADAVSEYAHEIIAYWDANASPREGTLCWEKNTGPPLYSRRSIKERLLANAQSEVRRAQWVCTYLAMFVSLLHTFTRGGARVQTLTCRNSPGVKTIVEHGTNSYACSFDKDCASTTPAVFFPSPSPPLPTRGGASLAEPSS